MRFTQAIASSSIALLTTLAVTDTAAAQLQPQAFYPLRTNLSDAVGGNGDVTLMGTPGPAAPNDGVCMNGVYRFSGQPNWTEIQTPDIPSVDETDFQINIQFEIAGLPANRAPVIMGGNGWRWIGIYIDGSGTVGIKHNNSNHLWSTTTLATGTWYSAELKYELGTVELYIDGTLALQGSIGPLSTNNNYNFMPTDYSNGTAFNGCIRDLMIANDTTLGVPTVEFYGTGCGPTTGGPIPEIGLKELPLLGSANFEITLVDGTAFTPAFLLLGYSRDSISLGGNCTQLLAAPFDTVTFGLADPNGELTIPIAVPSTPSLAGFFGYFQWVATDPNGPVNGTFTLSNALAVQVN